MHLPPFEGYESDELPDIPDESTVTLDEEHENKIDDEIDAGKDFSQTV